MKQFDDGYYIKEFSELDGSDENNEKLLMEGLVLGMSEIEHFSRFVVVKCMKCKNEHQIDVKDFTNWRNFRLPKECERCGDELIPIQWDKSLVRKVLFGEPKTSNPITLTGYVFYNDVYKIKPGEKIKINGILRSIKPNPKSETFKRVLDIKELSTSMSKSIMPTPEETTKFIELDKTQIIKSIAPRIKGHDLVKEALLIGMLGGVNDGEARGDINVLLAGDPGVAKTQMLKFVASIIQKSDYTSGKSASQAGLLAGVDNLADGTRVAKPGSVIMCNGGTCCIDEFEKMNPSDRAGLHEVMENQTFSLRKIGINMTWEAKTTIFAAANPRSSRWEPDLTIKENLNLPYSLLSRFGIIILIRDIPNRDVDLAVARHIRKIKQTGVEIILEPQMLTKFINYARTINPKISDESADFIEKFWIDLRCQSQQEGAILIDNRTLQDLYRFAEAYARLDLSEIVTAEHAKKAIHLLGETLKTLGMTVPGQVTQSMMAHINKEEFIMGLFKDGISEGSAIIRMMEHHQWFPTEESANRIISNLRSNGKIYETGGKLKWV